MSTALFNMDSLLQQVNQAVKTIDLLDGYNADVELEIENTLKPLIVNISSSLAQCRSQMKDTEEIYENRQHANTQLDLLLERIAYMKQNLPRSILELDAENNSPKVQVKIQQQQQPKQEANKPRDKSPLRPIENVEKVDTPKPRPGLQVAISYITNNEMQSVPQYMKGRLKIAEVNAFVDIYNNTINKKYAFLKKTKNSLKLKKDLDQWVEWKSHQELLSDEEPYFCTAKDFDTQSGVKLGKKDFSVIMILRHLKRIKETRNKKLVFYVASF